MRPVDGRVLSLEGRARVRHRVFGLVPPGADLPLRDSAGIAPAFPDVHYAIRAISPVID